MIQKNVHTSDQPPTVRRTPRSIWCIRLGILFLAFFLIAIGVWNGGATDVLKKAVAICTECIGLG